MAKFTDVDVVKAYELLSPEAYRETWPRIAAAKRNIAQYEQVIPRMEAEIKMLDAQVEAEQVQIRLAQDGRGRPHKAPSLARRKDADDELTEAVAGLKTEKLALAEMRKYVDRQYADYKLAFAKARELTTTAAQLAAAMRATADLQTRFFGLEDQLESITAGYPDGLGVPACPSAGDRQSQVALRATIVESVDMLSGAAEKRRRAAIAAQQTEQAAHEAEIAEGVAALRAAAEKFADVPAVRFAKAVLDSQVARFHATPKRAPDGSPNAGGTPEQSGRVSAWNAAGAAYAEYWHIVSKTAGMEEKAEFTPPMPDLGPMY